MKKRKWIYVMKPQEYEIHCDKCGGSNIEWSEFEHMIWCYDCKIDTHGDEGIFDGPIPWGASQLLGLSFARFYFKDKVIRYPNITKGRKIVWTKNKPDDELEVTPR